MRDATVYTPHIFPPPATPSPAEVPSTSAAVGSGMKHTKARSKKVKRTQASVPDIFLPPSACAPAGVPQSTEGAGTLEVGTAEGEDGIFGEAGDVRGATVYAPHIPPPHAAPSPTGVPSSPAAGGDEKKRSQTRSKGGTLAQASVPDIFFLTASTPTRTPPSAQVGGDRKKPPGGKREQTPAPTSNGTAPSLDPKPTGVPSISSAEGYARRRLGGTRMTTEDGAGRAATSTLHNASPPAASPLTGESVDPAAGKVIPTLSTTSVRREAPLRSLSSNTKVPSGKAAGGNMRSRGQARMQNIPDTTFAVRSSTSNIASPGSNVGQRGRAFKPMRPTRQFSGLETIKSCR